MNVFRTTMIGLVAVLALPAAARADGTTTIDAPFAHGDEITQCQWLTAATGLGTCAMGVDPNAESGAISVFAEIESPSSPAGAHTLPTWGQAVAQGTVFTGFQLAVPADRLSFTFTWHIGDVTFDTDGPPGLAWNNATAQATIEQVDCSCLRSGISLDLRPDASGTTVFGAVEFNAHQDAHDPFRSDFYRPIPPGTFVMKIGFGVQSGLIVAAGKVRTAVSGRIGTITVDQVDAPPPPPEA